VKWYYDIGRGAVFTGKLREDILRGSGMLEESGGKARGLKSSNDLRE